MNISKKMAGAINKQINAELESAYLYYSMSAYLESKNLPGFAKWMRIQADEEQVHAQKFYDYIVERGERVNLFAISKPQESWKNIKEVFEHTLKHEQTVTKLIYNLYSMAEKEKDYMTTSMLKWFIDEQVEEEATADSILQKIIMVKDSKNGLYMLDKELGSRK